MGSVVIGSQRPLDGCAGSPVVPDGGGHREQPLGDPGVDALGGAAAVPFEVELAFEGVVDRFDPLADPADGPVAWCLVAAVGTDQVDAEAGGDQVLEVPPGEALVADEDQPGPQGAGAAGMREPAGGCPASADLGAGQAPGDGHPVRGSDQVQLQPPVPAGMRGAVPVASPPGQLGPPDRLPRRTAGPGGGVDQPHLVLP